MIREVAEKLAKELGSKTLVGGHSREGVERENVTTIRRCRARGSAVG